MTGVGEVKRHLCKIKDRQEGYITEGMGRGVCIGTVAWVIYGGPDRYSWGKEQQEFSRGHAEMARSVIYTKAMWHRLLDA